MSWIMLVCAGLLEILWAYFMKKSAGFSLPVPTLLTLAMMLASFALLAAAMKNLPLGTAYTVWTGIGAVGAFVVGIAILGESVTPTRLIAAALIVIGILMMNLAGAR